MPCQIHNDIRRDIAHPITNDCRLYIEDKVLDQYELTLNKMAEAKEAREKTIPTPS
jgi:DNA-binding cell septation regulator SpoVG